MDSLASILRIGTRDNNNEPIVFSQQSTDAVIDERMRIDTGGDIVIANSIIIGVTGDQDGVSPYDESASNGAKPALVIKSKHQEF